MAPFRRQNTNLTDESPISLRSPSSVEENPLKGDEVLQRQNSERERKKRLLTAKALFIAIAIILLGICITLVAHAFIAFTPRSDGSTFSTGLPQKRSEAECIGTIDSAAISRLDSSSSNLCSEFSSVYGPWVGPLPTALQPAFTEWARDFDKVIQSKSELSSCVKLWAPWTSSTSAISTSTVFTTEYYYTNQAPACWTVTSTSDVFVYADANRTTTSNYAELCLPSSRPYMLSTATTTSTLTGNVPAGPQGTMLALISTVTLRKPKRFAAPQQTSSVTDTNPLTSIETCAEDPLAIVRYCSILIDNAQTRYSALCSQLSSFTALSQPSNISSWYESYASETRSLLATKAWCAITSTILAAANATATNASSTGTPQPSPTTMTITEGSYANRVTAGCTTSIATVSAACTVFGSLELFSDALQTAWSTRCQLPVVPSGVATVVTTLPSVPMTTLG